MRFAGLHRNQCPNLQLRRGAKRNLNNPMIKVTVENKSHVKLGVVFRQANPGVRTATGALANPCF
jgi:hypothetical protein